MIGPESPWDASRYVGFGLVAFTMGLVSGFALALVGIAVVGLRRLL